MPARSHLCQQVGAAQPRAWLASWRLSALLLLTLVTTFSTISLVDAQMMRGDGGETIAGRIVVRVHGLADGHKDGAYRMEFGFMTEAMLESGRSRSAVIAANRHLLPSSRFMSEAAWLKRAGVENRDWVSSSPVRIPIAGNGDTESAYLVGRVIARWSPKQDGPFRVEFGFLPEWTLDSVSSPGDSVSEKVQQAMVLYQSLLPERRYLTEDGITAERHRSTAQWLRSGSVEVPLRPPPAETAVAPEEELNARISCTLLSVGVGASVDCEGQANGGTPPYTSFSWSAPGATLSSVPDESLSLHFHSTGTYSVHLTITDGAGRKATTSASITVTDPPLSAVSVSCAPEKIIAGETVTCRASISGGTPPYISAWSAEGAVPPSIQGENLEASFPRSGTYIVRVTVTDGARRQAVGSAGVVVEPHPLTVSVSCSVMSVRAGESTVCEAQASGGTAPHTYSWNAPGASPASGAGQSLRLTFQEPGSYSVKATATDSDGQTTDGRTSVEVEVVPTVVIVLCVPSNIQEGSSTTCEASAGGGTPPYTSYSWDVPGASPSSGSGQSIWLTFESAGTYPVEVAVADSRGQRSVGSTSVEVEVGPPTVNVSCSPSSVEEGGSATCWANASGGAPPYTYSWNARWASPSFGSGPSLRLTFNYAGAGDVEVTVTDDLGQRIVGRTSVAVKLPPLTVTVTCTPSTITVGDSTNCATRCSGANSGTLCRYYRLWSTTGAEVVQTYLGARDFTLKYREPGTYSVQVRVTNAVRWKEFATTTVTVVER